MKKSISNLGNVLSKTEQTEIAGGLKLIKIKSCAQTCVNAPRGTRCGPPHCPGACDGNGGFWRY